MTTSLPEQRLASIKSEKPEARAARAKTAKKAGKLPPGQRLVRLVATSCLLVLLPGCATPLSQAWKSFNSCPQDNAAAASAVPPPPPPIKLSIPLDELRSKLMQVSALKNLHAGVFVSEQSTGRYVDMNGYEAFPAASMIKLPVFVALLSAVEAGKIKPEQMLEIKPEHVTGGSGWLQWRPVGSKLSVKDTADLMITISDNTATNMLIDLLGGKEACNKQFTDWGLANTKINNWLGDFEGTNTTSPYDLVYLLARVDRGEILGTDTNKWLDQTMSRTRIRTLLPPGLGPGARIAHKTGDIACMVGDAGIVTLPSGEKYFVSVQVTRPRNDRRANLLIRSLSKMIYQCFSTHSVNGAEVAVVPLESMSGGAPQPLHHHHRHHRRA